MSTPTQIRLVVGTLLIVLGITLVFVREDAIQWVGLVVALIGGFVTPTGKLYDKIMG